MNRGEKLIGGWAFPPVNQRAVRNQAPRGGLGSFAGVSLWPRSPADRVSKRKYQVSKFNKVIGRLLRSGANTCQPRWKSKVRKQKGSSSCVSLQRFCFC